MTRDALGQEILLTYYEALIKTSVRCSLQQFGITGTLHRSTERTQFPA